MTNEELAETLAGEFLIKDYKWNFPDGERVPLYEDFIEAFDNLKKSTPEGSFQIAGRLVAINYGGHFDIYMHMGEI